MVLFSSPCHHGYVTVTEISHTTVYLARQVIAGRAVEPAYGVYTTVGGLRYQGGEPSQRRAPKGATRAALTPAAG